MDSRLGSGAPVEETASPGLLLEPAGPDTQEPVRPDTPEMAKPNTLDHEVTMPTKMLAGVSTERCHLPPGAP